MHVIDHETRNEIRDEIQDEVRDEIQAEAPPSSVSDARPRWRWIFPVLIVVGLILVLASLIYLMQRKGTEPFVDGAMYSASLSL